MILTKWKKAFLLFTILLLIVIGLVLKLWMVPKPILSDLENAEILLITMSPCSPHAISVKDYPEKEILSVLSRHTERNTLSRNINDLYDVDLEIVFAENGTSHFIYLGSNSYSYSTMSGFRRDIPDGPEILSELLEYI